MGNGFFDAAVDFPEESIPRKTKIKFDSRLHIVLIPTCEELKGLDLHYSNEETDIFKNEYMVKFNKYKTTLINPEGISAEKLREQFFDYEIEQERSDDIEYPIDQTIMQINDSSNQRTYSSKSKSQYYNADDLDDLDNLNFETSANKSDTPRRQQELDHQTCRFFPAISLEKNSSDLQNNRVTAHTSRHPEHREGSPYREHRATSSRSLAGLGMTGEQLHNRVNLVGKRGI